ncbi:MAG: bifunctional diaminohydroxyphosphoribosylaminopyrimidine deaminase/5-amino-6-(5-phosphoribosylamino)uracil reductase RibD, partial [Bdellovibrionales bacterium]
MSENHEFYMQRALGLAGAGLGRVWPNPSVGCVVVKDGAVIGEARTQDGGRPHAEEYVLGALGDAARGATAYVTLEPCCHARETINCTQNLIRAGVARVVIACADPDPRMAGRGIAALRAAGIDVVTGVLEEDAKKGHQGFFLRVTQNRPYVLLKQAISRDGMIAAAPGVRTQISGAQAHRYVHELRATYDAVAVGVNTVLADDPLLTTRLEGINHRIVRIVFDSDLRIPLGSKLVQTAGHDPLWAL